MCMRFVDVVTPAAGAVGGVDSLEEAGSLGNGQRSSSDGTLKKGVEIGGERGGGMEMERNLWLGFLGLDRGWFGIGRRYVIGSVGNGSVAAAARAAHSVLCIG